MITLAPCSSIPPNQPPSDLCLVLLLRTGLQSHVSNRPSQKCTKKKRESLTQSHAHADVCVLHHLGKLLKANLAVLVQIRLHDGLVHDLL